MDMHSRNQYLKVLQERYFQARSKKEKSSILDEYHRNILRQVGSRGSDGKRTRSHLPGSQKETRKLPIRSSSPPAEQAAKDL